MAGPSPSEARDGASAAHHISDLLPAGLVVLLTVVVAAQAWYRYVLNDSLTWSETASKLIVVALAFSSAVGSEARGGWTNLGLIDRLLSSRPLLLGLPRHLVVLVSCLILVISAAPGIHRLAGIRLSGTALPLVTGNWIILLFGAATVLASAINVLRLFRR